MSISLSTRQAYSELDSVLDVLDEEDRNKIPIKLRQLLKREKDHNYIKTIDINKSIEEQNLKEETLTLIAILNLKYWCEDEGVKEKLKERYLKNEEIYQKKLDEKYNLDNLFKRINNEKNENITVENAQKNLIEYKESIIRKIFNKIKAFFISIKKIKNK